MKIENLDHRICEDGSGIPSITLGCGGMNITGIIHEEFGGVAFAPKVAGPIGEKNPESCGKTPEEIGTVLQIRATKKPVKINFMRFTEEDKNAVYSWCREIQQNIQPSTNSDGKPTLIVPTLEGDMICSIGDYLIKEPFPTDWRKFYPCKPDIFALTYDF